MYFPSQNNKIIPDELSKNKIVQVCSPPSYVKPKLWNWFGDDQERVEKDNRNYYRRYQPQI